MSGDDEKTTADVIAQPLLTRDESPAPEWSSLEGSEPLKRWSDELRSSMDSRDADDWRLTGTAALLICPDIETSRGAIRRVAADAGYALFTLAPDDISAIYSSPAPPEAVPALVFLESGLWQADPGDPARLWRKVPLGATRPYRCGG